MISYIWYHVVNKQCHKPLEIYAKHCSPKNSMESYFKAVVFRSFKNYGNGVTCTGVYVQKLRKLEKILQPSVSTFDFNYYVDFWLYITCLIFDVSLDLEGLWSQTDTVFSSRNILWHFFFYSRRKNLNLTFKEEWAKLIFAVVSAFYIENCLFLRI